MNKELTPLEAFEKILDMAHEPNGYQNFTNACDTPYTKIVRTALEGCEIDCKDYKLEEALVNLERHSKRYKGRKEDLDTLFNVVKGYQYQKKNIRPLIVENKMIKDKSNTLDIIKNKGCSYMERSLIVACRNYEDYCVEMNSGRVYPNIYECERAFKTQQEFNLLREVLI